jgi:phosphoribosylamine--glycine ligase
MSRPIMPTRIVILGGGGREHALAWKLASEPGINEVVVAPGNAGIATVPRVRTVSGFEPTDAAAVVALARAESAELVVIGPEAPLAAGVADALTAAGVPVFGPTAAAARIETSKAFCHEVAAVTGVPMAAAAVFDDAAGAIHHARGLVARTGWAVVKADGLAAGKGVSVCEGPVAAESAIRALFADGRRALVVIEERLVGREASVIALCDGRTAVALPPARDHKRLRDGDDGPNTGGMGAYSPLSDLGDEEVGAIVEMVHRPIIDELARRGTPFRGALYAGLMLTESGPRLLECNARFGDPETQVIMPRLSASLGPFLLAAANGELASVAATVAPGDVFPPLPGAVVGIVLAAAGYPDTPRRGDAIAGIGDATGGLIFHAGTARDADGSWRTAGGRVLTLVGEGCDLTEAREVAETMAARIFFDGVQRRRDIGLPAPGRPVAAVVER